jgi:hypothetical protein
MIDVRTSTRCWQSAPFGFADLFPWHLGLNLLAGTSAECFSAGGAQ